MSLQLKQHFWTAEKLVIDDQVKKMMDQYFPTYEPETKISDWLQLSVMARKKVIEKKLAFSIMNTRYNLDTLKFEVGWGPNGAEAMAKEMKLWEFSEAMKLCAQVESKMSWLIWQTMQSDNYEFDTNLDKAA